MTKHYWMEVSIGGYDAEGNIDIDSGYASGGRIDIDWTDEQIRALLDVDIHYLLLEIQRLRDLEAEEARKAAEPFWRKWLGA
jgi:hypothetical protein